MEHMSLRTKVIILLTVALALACLATGWIFVLRMQRSGERQVEQAREQALAQISQRLKEEVDIGIGILDAFKDSSDDPAARARQQERAKSVIRGIRFAKGSGYIFVYDTAGTCLVLGTKREWEGQSKIGVTDPNGRPYVKDLIAKGRLEGGDTVHYWFSKPPAGTLIPKIAASRIFDKWSWIVGTGVYVDDIDSLVAQRKAQISQEIRHGALMGSLVALLAAALLIAIGIVLTRKALVPLGKLQHRMVSISQGTKDLTVRLESTAEDEVGVTSRAFNRSSKASPPSYPGSSRIPPRSRDRRPSCGRPPIRTARGCGRSRRRPRRSPLRENRRARASATSPTRARSRHRVFPPSPPHWRR